MAGNISATTILYSTPLVAKVGDLLLTATRIEVPGSANAEEYVEGGIQLLPAKLGLTDEAVSGAQSVAREASIGTLNSTTGLPGLIWSSGLLVDGKTDNEAQKEITATHAFPCQVTLVKGVPYLRVFATVTAGQDKGWDEVKVKQNLELLTTTIYALGK